MSSNSASGSSAASAPVDLAALYKRMFDAVKPKLRTSDLPSGGAGAHSREQLTQIVHQALALCPTYAEVASFVRNALSRLDNDKQVWSVAVSRGLYIKAKKQPQSTSTLSAPALLGDLLYLARHAKTQQDAISIISSASRSPLLAFTVLIFKAGSDEADYHAQQDQYLSPPLPSCFTEPIPSLVELGEIKPAGGDYEIQRAVLGDLVFSPTTSSSSSSSVHGSTDGDKDKDKEAVVGPVAQVVRAVGALQKKLTGLDSASEGSFAAGLQYLLTKELGGPTWHVFLAPAAHHKASSAHSSTGKAIVAASNEDGGSDSTSSSSSPSSSRLTLGGLVPKQAMLGLMASPAHAPGYDVVFDSTLRSATVLSEMQKKQLALAQQQQMPQDSGASGSASGSGSTSSSATKGSNSAPVSRRRGGAGSASTVTDSSTTNDEVGAASSTSIAAVTLQEVRYMELVLRSHKLTTAPSSSSATGADSSATTADNGSSSITPDYYHVLAFRTTHPFLQALAEGAVDKVLSNGVVVPGGGVLTTSSSASSSSSATARTAINHASALAGGMPVKKAAAGAGSGGASGSSSRSDKDKADDLASASIKRGRSGGNGAVCCGIFPSWTHAIELARIGLYMLGGLSFVVFLAAYYWGNGGDMKRGLGCARFEREVPFIPAMAVLLMGAIPSPFNEWIGLGRWLREGALPADIIPFIPALNNNGAALPNAGAAAGGGGGEQDLSLPAGCSMQQAVAAELASGQRMAGLYVAGACLLLVSALRWARKTYEANRLKAVLKSVAREKDKTGVTASTAAVASAGNRRR